MSTSDTVNILMVDDQPAKLLSYEAILSDLEVNLIKAASGREALELLLKTEIAIVLMDVSMPELDGFELASIIRQHPRYQKTAIIFISGVHLTDLDRLKGYEVGAVDYLPVPVIPEILRAKVSVFAELYRKTRQLEALNQDLEQRVEERTAELVASTEQLREREEQFRGILHNTSSVIYLLDTNDRFIHVNRCFAELFGVNVAEIIGCSIFEVLPQEVAAALKDRHRQVITAHAAGEFEEVFVHPAGTRTYTSIKTPLFDERGRPRGILGVSTDITARKQAEDERNELLLREREARMTAETALQLRDDFLAVAAHELKTPVTGLRINAQLILRRLQKGEDQLPPWFGERLNIIDQQSDRLTRLIGQLLNVSRLDQDKLLVERKPHDVTVLVEQLVSAAQSRTTRHTLVLAADANLLAEIEPEGIEQVASNLIDNAIKYSPDGCQIDIDMHRTSDDYISLSVRDRGLGIPPEKRDAIFDRFYQAHATDHRSGLGLGLYISKQIIEAHDGKITAEFPPDGGTRFEVTLPVQAKALKPIKRK